MHWLDDTEWSDRALNMLLPQKHYYLLGWRDQLQSSHALVCNYSTAQS